MKLVFQAIISSLILHFVFLGGILLFGIIQKRNQLPDIAASYENVTMLQSETAFGMVISPVYIFLSFTAAAVISGLFIFLLNKKQMLFSKS